MSSRIEQIIEEIEEYIDGCKHQALTPSNIIVNKEQMDELLHELRTKTPEEIKRYQKIISNKEAILADAQAKADSIIAQAQIETNELVSEHQIMQQAYAQANEVVVIATKQAQEIIDQAMNESNAMKLGAVAYTDDLLKSVEELLANSIETSKARSESLISSLQNYLDVVSANRAEMNQQTQPAPEEPKAEETPAPEEVSKEAETPELNTDLLDS